MAIRRNYQHPASGLLVEGAYFRSLGWQRTDAPMTNADRAIIWQLGAFPSRELAHEGRGAIPDSVRTLSFVAVHGSRTESGAEELVLRDGDRTIAIDAADLPTLDAWHKGLGYALLQKYHPSFQGADSVLEPGQEAVALG